MADYQIVCVTKKAGHGHIQTVGIGSASGVNATKTVQEVYALLDVGNSFHTGSAVGGNYATVAKYKCSSCDSPTLRSHADSKWNNNLDNLKSC